jgi:hypothetical protein
VNHALGGGPAIPWTEAGLRAMMERYKAGGLSVSNPMIGGLDNALYGRPGRDEEIDEVCPSIRAAGRVGLPVIECRRPSAGAPAGSWAASKAGSEYTGVFPDEGEVNMFAVMTELVRQRYPRLIPRAAQERAICRLDLQRGVRRPPFPRKIAPDPPSRPISKESRMRKLDRTAVRRLDRRRGLRPGMPRAAPESS